MTDSHRPQPYSELDDERFAEAALSELEPVRPSAVLTRRVAQIPLEHAQGTRWWWPFDQLWQPAAGLAAAAALGLIVGGLVPVDRIGAPAETVSAVASPPAAVAERTAGAEETSATTDGPGEVRVAAQRTPNQARATGEVAPDGDGADVGPDGGTESAADALAGQQLMDDEVEAYLALALGDPWVDDALWEGDELQEEAL